MPALEGLAAAAEEEQRPTALSASHGVTVTPQIMRPPSAVSNVVELRASDRGPAALSQAGAPLSWTSERADTLFVCERVRKAAATERQPQRAERAM